MSKPVWRRGVVALGLTLACCCGARLEARVYSPRIVSSRTADAYSARTFAESPQWRDLEGDAKARALFEYLSDPRTGLFPLGAGAFEGNDKAYEHALVRDPVKVLNVYGYAYCDVLGPVMAALWEQGGLGPARTVDLPEFAHVAAEVYYGDRWHYLDLDLRAAFLRPDGSLASLAEAREDDRLWETAQGPRFFPRDEIAKVRGIYRDSAVRHRYGVAPGGHTMDFVLRQGETFTRWWSPQQGRWNHHSEYNTDAGRKQILEAEPRGPKSKHADFTVHSHGNGRFVYRPNLTDRSTDFDDGVYHVDNVRPGTGGLTLAEAGEGFAVFEIQSPYVIVPLVGDFADEKDDREASTVEVDGQGLSVLISLDHGATWQPLEVKDWPAQLDLTKQVSGKYQYLLRIDLKGKPDEAVLRSLTVTTWVQVAPASLPALHEGKNELELRTGDHYGLPTRVVRIRPDAGDLAALSRYIIHPPSQYDPKSRTSRLQGTFTLRANAAPQTRIAWFNAGASFQTHQLEGASGTRNSIAWATSAPADFQTIYEADVPADQEHWHYNIDREIRLDDPARAVYLQYTGDPAVNNIRIDLHCLDDRPPPQTPLRITHVWSEAGERREFTTSLDEANRYEVEAGKEPVNESIEFGIASGNKEQEEP